jgi:sortase A
VRFRSRLSALERGLRGLFRLRLSRRANGLAGGLAIFLGVALLADAVVTVAWRDPITAVFAQQRQKALDKELKKTERAPLSASTLALVRNAETKEERLAALAKHLRVRSEVGDPLGRIAIPRIDAKYVFVAGTGEKSLKKAPGHYANTALPGQPGTVAIAGHRTTYLAPFRRLDRMRRGDRVQLTMPYGRFSYRVDGSWVVSPSHTAVLRPARYDRLVLTTCTPLFSAKRRIVVTARLVRATLGGPIADQIPLAPTAPL